jgi:hypothetical protein
VPESRGVSLLLSVVLCGSLAAGPPTYPWRRAALASSSSDTLLSRIPAPSGAQRVPAPEGSYAAWLRSLPLRAPGTPVRLYDGRVKSSQEGAVAVLDLDVGVKDLQQCADAVMRLRAEYLWASGCAEHVAFKFTSGHQARWSQWRTGLRPLVEGSHVSWVQRSPPDATHDAFRRYLDVVFTYAGSASLARELAPVADPTEVRTGDVFIQGGFPGHAVLVADVVEDDGGDAGTEGARSFLLLQSYMPAQDVHLLVNPEHSPSPWFPARALGALVTPDWTFARRDLRRFTEPDCDATLERNATGGKKRAPPMPLGAPQPEPSR